MQREDLVDLNAFFVIAEERSFTRAAARLSTSQSALSHTLRRLETRLGVRLLTRTTRNVAPTDAGEQLLETLRPAFENISDRLLSLSDLREKPSGTIRLTVPDHAARIIVWPALKRLLRDYPDVNVEMSVDSGFADIVSDRFDAGIRLGEAIAKDMIAVRIGPDLRMVVIASPEYLRLRGTPQTPQDLANHKCINLRMPTSGAVYAWELDQADRQLKVRVDGQLTFNNTEMIVSAAVEGFGLGFVMEDMAAPYIAAGQLRSVLDDWSLPFPGYHLYYPSRRQPSAAFTLIVDALRYRG